MIINLTYPISNVIKTFLTGTIICQNDTLSTSIICLGYCSKPFLTGCIPYLDFDVFAIEIDCIDFEVNSYKLNK